MTKYGNQLFFDIQISCFIADFRITSCSLLLELVSDPVLQLALIF